MIDWSEKSEKHFKSELNKLNRVHKIQVDPYFTKDGHVEITNSHCAVRLKNVVNVEEENESDYPNLDDLFKRAEKAKALFTFKEISEFCSVIKPFVDFGFEHVFIDLDKRGIAIESEWDPQSEYLPLTSHLNRGIKGTGKVSFAVNAEYLHNCFMLFKKLKVEEVDLYFTSEVKPLLFRGENLDYIIAPVGAHKKK